MNHQSKIARDLPELFRERLKLQKAANPGVRHYFSMIREDKASTRTAKVYFDHISQSIVNSIKVKFPNTVKMLYHLSKKILEGLYGDEFQILAMSLSNKLLNHDTMLQLLHDEVVRNPNLQLEVFKEDGPQRIDLQVKRSELDTLVQIFRESLTNIMNPSNVNIKMISETVDNLDQAIEEALRLKNKEEKTKSLVYLVELLLTRNSLADINKAQELINHIDKESERIKPLFKLIEKLSYPNKAEIRAIDERIPLEKIMEIVEAVKTLSDEEIRYKGLKNIAIGFARHNNVEDSLRIANLITLQDIRAHAKSSSIKMFVNNKLFHEGIWLLGHLSEPDHREDAIGYIIKGLLDDNQENEVVAFINQLKNPREIKHAAKIVYHAFKGKHDLERANYIKSRFLD